MKLTKGHFFLIAGLCFSSLTSANDTAFGGSGAAPYPVSENGIKMVNEKIIISGFNLNDDDFGGGWRYHCDFTFKNTRDKAVTLRMGFPFPVYDQHREVALPKGKKIKKGDAMVYDFKLRIDGKPVKAKKQNITANEEKGLYYQKAYLWPMAFKPLQTVSIQHQYDTGATFNVMGYHMVNYVLKTGALWKDGKIGHSRVEVIPNVPTRLCAEVEPQAADNYPTKPKGMQIKGEGKNRQYIWDLKDFHPEDDLFLCLQTGKNYVRYQLVFRIIQAGSDMALPLDKMTKKQLNTLRNSIYAQYGREFKSAGLQHYFNQQWWYEPNPDYSDKMLTEEDKKAIKILHKYEGIDD